MDVFLMVRRKMTTIFVDAKETTTVLQLKKIIEGVTRSPPEDQELYKDEKAMEDSHSLGDYGLNSASAKAQDPATVGLAIREPDTGEFESLEITELTIPPELPDVMKPEAQIHDAAVA